MEKGKLIIISGFSGVGKGTVVKKIKEEYSNYQVSVSATTREPRYGEINGIHYHFISNKAFEEMIEKKQLLEYAEYVNHYYGTPKEFVDKNIEKGNNVILEIETKGALKVKANMPDAIMVFVLPPDGKTLRDRLVGRGTEPEEVIRKRLAKAAEETRAMEYYEYFVINDEIEKCANNINKIVTGDEPDLPCKEQVEQIKNDILKFSKGE